MDSFNEKLKEIRILEIIGITILFIFILGLFEIDIEWISILLIAYILFRTRNELKSLNKSIKNLFTKISIKTWLLLGIASYVFALGSGMFFEENLSGYTLFYILGGTGATSGSILFFMTDFLSTVIFGPILEELVIRGIFFNRLKRKLPTIAAILLTSILFSLYHPIEACLSTLIFAITMCIVYLVTENIVVPISLHMLNNLISLCVPYIPNLELIINTEIGKIILAALTVISLIYLIYFNITNYFKYQNVEKTT